MRRLLAHLLRYDSCFGKYAGTVEVRGKDLVVNGRLIQVVAERDASRLPWKELNVDIVIESTGLFASAEKAQAHLNAGAKRVIISCPAKGTKSFVMGVDHLTFDPATDYIVDNASCTTNCLAPVAKVLQDRFGIVSQGNDDHSTFYTTIRRFWICRIRICAARELRHSPSFQRQQAQQKRWPR